MKGAWCPSGLLELHLPLGGAAQQPPGPPWVPLHTPLVCNPQALHHVNARLRDLYPNEQDLFDVVLMTNNHAQVGVRLINSVNHYGK